jgi:hypothetical protein
MSCADAPASGEAPGAPAFTFHNISTATAFPLSLNLVDVQTYLNKWGVAQSMVCAKFRYDAPFNPADEAQSSQFIRELLASPAFHASAAGQIALHQPTQAAHGRSTVAAQKGWVRTTGLHPSVPIIVATKPATLTSLAFLDPLVEAGVVSRDWDPSKTVISNATVAPASAATAAAAAAATPVQGKAKSGSAVAAANTARPANFLDLFASNSAGAGRLSQCYESYCQAIRVDDGFRAALFDSDSAAADTVPPSVRRETLFSVLRLLAGGSGLAQADDTLLPYADVAKRLYKDLVAPRRNPHTHAIEVSSAVWQVKSAVFAVEPETFTRGIIEIKPPTAAADVATPTATAAPAIAELAQGPEPSMVAIVGDGDLTGALTAAPAAPDNAAVTESSDKPIEKASDKTVYAPLFPPASSSAWAGGSSSSSGCSGSDSGSVPAAALLPSGALAAPAGPHDLCLVSVSPDTKTVAYLYFKHFAVY